MNNVGCERLRGAIIESACVDYEKALLAIKRTRGKTFYTVFKMKSECETFFRSDWFRTLCDLDGEWVIEQIRKKVGYDGE